MKRERMTAPTLFPPLGPEPLRMGLLAADPVVRAAFERQLSLMSELEIVASEGSWEALEALLHSDSLDAVVWDLGIGGWTGEAEQERTDSVPVVVLVANEPMASEAMRLGAAAVLSRNVRPGALAAAILAVAEGLWVLDPAFTSLRVSPLPAPVVDALTPREREVLKLLAEGLANKSIALRLAISEHTAKFHVNAILQKLQVTSRTEAVVRAARLGWIAL